MSAPLKETNAPQPATDAGDLEQPATQPHTGADDVGDDLLPALLCPRDGAMLSGTHNVGGGRYECPRCRGTFHVTEVYTEA